VRGWSVAALPLAALVLAAPAHSQQEPESTCITCHAAEEDEALSAPVEEWRRSVHAAANVGCDSCHGGDPQQEDQELSMDEDAAGYVGSPGRKDVIAFCAGCHEQIADGFRQSVMGRKSTEGEKAANCTTCHMVDGHAIPQPDPRQILTKKRCGQCHEGNRAIALRDEIERLRGLIRRADARVAPLRGAIDTSLLDGELKDALEHSVVIAHTYDLARIQEVAKGTAERLGTVKAKAERLESEVASRRRIGVASVAFLGIGCLLTIRISSSVKRRSSSHEGE
jgi:hypothetical protein